MATTEVLLYQEPDGTIPVLDWLKELQRTNNKAFENACSYSVCWKNSGTIYDVPEPTCYGTVFTSCVLRSAM